MLVSFSLGNFLSFKDIQTLSLTPESLKDLKDNLIIPYLYSHDERLLKSVAIYGHNSYGKSNFIKGFQFFQQLIFNSFSAGQVTTTIATQPFLLNPVMALKPSFFEIVFIIKEIKYRYTVTLTATEVIEEGLYYAESRIRENYLFERGGQEFKVSKNWNKDAGNKIDQVIFFTKPHILFLSVLFSQPDIPKVQDICNWLNANLIIPDDYLKEIAKARLIYSDLKYQNLISKFIKAADIGFTTIFDKLENLSKSHLQLEKGFLNMLYEKEIKDFVLYTRHDVYNDERMLLNSIEFELQKDESAGSIKYFIIVSLLAYAIKNSQLIWVDELDSRFDSGLLEMLIQSFHNPEINPINSQMIFTTHNTVLLDKKLRRDQMVMVEKDKYGESKIRRMHSSKKPIRVGKSVEKEYRKGDFGGKSKNISNPSLFD